MSESVKVVKSFLVVPQLLHIKPLGFLSVMNRLWVGANVVCEDGKLGSVVEVFLSHR